jgi:predicted nucleic acid-binding protein
MTPKRFVDSNVIAYAYDHAERNKQARAAALLKTAWSGKQHLHISVQVLAESSRVLTQKLKRPYTAQEAAEILSTFETPDWSIHPYTLQTVVQALSLLKHNLSFWDALIIATMLENGITEIYTEDGRFSKVSGIKVINPFA